MSTPWRGQQGQALAAADGELADTHASGAGERLDEQRRLAEGGRCPTCERVRRDLQAEREAAEDAARSNGILARLRARTEGQ